MAKTRERAAAPKATTAALAPLFEQVDAVVVAIDGRGRLAFVSPSVRLVLGYDPVVLAGSRVLTLLDPDCSGEIRASWSDLVSRSGTFDLDPVRVCHADGSWVDMSLRLRTGSDVHDFGVAIATLKQESVESTPMAELRSRLSADDRLVSLASSFVGLPMERFDEGVTAALALLGSMRHVDRASVMRVRGDEMVRTHQWCAPGVPSSARPVFPLSWVEERFHGPNGLRDMYFEVPEVDPLEAVAGLGDMRSEGILSTFAVPLSHQGTFAGFVSYGSREIGPLRDHTAVGLLRSAAGLLGEAFARHDAELLLAHRARHDLLTGLANRWAFAERLDEALAARSGPDGGFALLLIDIDRFKVVNDSMGHLVGDELLALIARRLEVVAGPGEHLARLGGDEIGVLMEEVTGSDSALGRARELTDALSDPFEIGNHEILVTVSGGVALALPDMEPDDLLRRADAAMFRAKARGRRRVEVFDEALLEQVTRRLEWETDLSRALRDHQLTLHYQPEIELGTGKVTGTEALLRWHHPTRGLLAAGEFIEIAEETGAIVEIGDWVLAAACRQLARWQSAGLDMVVRVNLSARQVNHPGLVDRLVQIIEESGVSVHSLCLELTETAVMADPEMSLEVLGKLAGLGVQLAVDDFGTGYSSLSHLKRFPVQVLKIDQSFVDGLGRSADDAAIVAAIMSVAEALSLEVTAEGIETEMQRDVLIELGCLHGQGYLYAPAVTHDEFEARLGPDGTWRR